jgi:hypothetical protein
MENTELLTPKEVAEAVGGIAPETAREWMERGKVPGAQSLGSTYIIEKGALDEALKQGLDVDDDIPAQPNGREWVESYTAQDMLGSAGIQRVHVTVLDWLRKGVLPGVKAGKSWAVHRPTLERMLREGFDIPQRGRPPKGGTE